MAWFQGLTVVLCLLLGAGLFAVASQVSKINATLARLAPLLRANEAEHRKAAAEDHHRRETRHKHLVLWLAETASTLKRIRNTLERLELRAVSEEPRKTVALEPGPVSSSRGAAVDAPPTVRALKTQSGEAARGTPEDAQIDRPGAPDAATQRWAARGSSCALIGVGATIPPMLSPLPARTPDE